MRVPHPQAAAARRVEYGCYVEAALIVEGLEEEAAAVRRHIEAVKQAGRALEDTQERLFGARARRDLADWQLDTSAKTLRLSLASRGLNAARSAPYTLIFPDGIAFYVDAPIPQQQQRYTLLRERVGLHLQEDDPLRAPFVADLDRHLAQWGRAQATLEETRRLRAHGSQALEEAERAFDKQMTEIWADRVKAEGKPSAERYFPKPARRTDTRVEEPGGPDPVG